MPIIRIKEIAGMSSEDRNKKLNELRVELSHIRTMISAGGAIENPTRSRELRRAIAQLLTIENETRLGIRAQAKDSGKSTLKKPKTTAAKGSEETKPQ